MATVTGGGNPFGVAVTPDGEHAYVTNQDGTVSVIETSGNTVVATVTVMANTLGVAITPDGKHAYVTNNSSSNFSVIETTGNTVVATVTVESFPRGIAITPDGKRAYLANVGTSNVSVIETSGNTVVATVGVGSAPVAVGIVPPPPGLPFAAFSDFIVKLEIAVDKPKHDSFELNSSFMLGRASNGINPPAEPVTLQIGTFTTTIPSGSFKGKGFGPFTFEGVINRVALEVRIAPTGAKRYSFQAEAQNASLTGTKNPVQVTLTIGDDSGTASVKAEIH